MAKRKQQDKDEQTQTTPTENDRIEEEVVDDEELVPAEPPEDALTDDDSDTDELLLEEISDSDSDSDDGTPDDEISDDDSEESETARPRRRTRLADMRRSSHREDPVKTYLREIGKYPLLTKEEEVELAMAMEKSDWVHAIRNGADALSRTALPKKGVPEAKREELKERVKRGKEAAKALGLASKLSDADLVRTLKEKGQELEEIAAQAREARERLTISNLRLVVSIAKRYTNRGLSFLDLIQEGNMGLMKAVEKFDYTKGFKFSTYATWWIRQAITRAIADQSRTIRVPVHMIETVRDLSRIKREFIQKHGAAPTLEDLSKLMNMSIDKIKKVENVSSYTASLERPIGEEDEDTLGDFIEDPSSPSPTKETFRMFLKEQLNRALDQLDEREREILRLRYGLDDGHPRTLKDVSLKFNITRERVRQIEIKAIEKLKHPSRRTELKRFRELLLGED